MSIVVDASIVVAWLFADERSKTARSVLRRIVTEGAIVPAHWRLEIANALRSAVRRQRCDEAYTDRCLARLGRLRIATDPETNVHAWAATRTLAKRHDLTVYDAAYLELAIRSGMPLASLDLPLVNAGRENGIEQLTG